MRLKPVGEKLIVMPLKRKENEINGIIIPSCANEELSEGKVVEVPNYLDKIYNKGDVVLYPTKKGTEIIYNEEIHIFLNGQEYPQGDIWAIIGSD